MDLLTMLCAYSTIQLALASVSLAEHNEVQILLSDWGLTHAFGHDFADKKYTKRDLLGATKADIDEEFPNVSPIHRRSLWNSILELSERESRHSRQLSSQVDWKSYTGVNIRHDKSFLTMGKDDKIKLFRDTSGNLKINAPAVDFVASSVTVNGDKVTGGGSSKDDIEAAIAPIDARVKHLESALGPVFDNVKCNGRGVYDITKETCTCDDDYIGKDCGDLKHQHEGEGKGLSPCELIAKAGDTSAGVKSLVIDGKKQSFWCEDGWMLVFSVGCLRNAVGSNIFANSGAVGDCVNKKDSTCKFDDKFINKAKGARGYKLQIFGNVGGNTKPRYVKPTCVWDSKKTTPTTACRESWSSTSFNSGKTTGSHGASYGLDLKLPDCDSHGLVSTFYHYRGKTFQTCGRHCEDSPCKSGKGCNIEVWV